MSKSLRERIYKTHLCPYLVWISQNRKQITREQIDYTPLWSYMTWASQKMSKSTRERIYNTHLCPYLVWISQNRKQITREQIDYTPLWSYMTWASQKVSKSPRYQYILQSTSVSISGFNISKYESKFTKRAYLLYTFVIIYDSSISKSKQIYPGSEYITAHLCPYLLWISQNWKQIAREQIDYTPLLSYITWASQKSEQISQRANIQNTSVSISCLNISK